MSLTLDEAVTKIKKLLALSKSDNINEAALAAAKAANLPKTVICAMGSMRTNAAGCTPFVSGAQRRYTAGCISNTAKGSNSFKLRRRITCNSLTVAVL